MCQRTYTPVGCFIRNLQLHLSDLYRYLSPSHNSSPKLGLCQKLAPNVACAWVRHPQRRKPTTQLSPRLRACKRAFWSVSMRHERRSPGADVPATHARGPHRRDVPGVLASNILYMESECEKCLSSNPLALAVLIPCWNARCSLEKQVRSAPAWDFANGPSRVNLHCNVGEARPPGGVGQPTSVSVWEAIAVVRASGLPKIAVVRASVLPKIAIASILPEVPCGPREADPARRTPRGGPRGMPCRRPSARPERPRLGETEGLSAHGLLSVQRLSDEIGVTAVLCSLGENVKEDLPSGPGRAGREPRCFGKSLPVVE